MRSTKWNLECCCPLRFQAFEVPKEESRRVDAFCLVLQTTWVPAELLLYGHTSTELDLENICVRCVGTVLGYMNWRRLSDDARGMAEEAPKNSGASISFGRQ